jgi:uncharacterized protein (UPF0276 family)
MSIASIGYQAAWHERLLSETLSPEERPDALQIVPDHFFARPAALEALADRYPLLLHDVGCSLASGGPDPQHLRRLQDLVRRARPLGFSDHLSLTRSPSGQIDLGHLCPCWYTEQTLQEVVDGVKRLQDALSLPVGLENIATPFVLPGTLSEAEFWSALVERTGCSLLLDVTNVLLDARNQGEDPVRRLEGLPLQAARWVHLAGGLATGAYWIDSHSEPVEEASYLLLREIVGRAPVEMLIVERDSHLPPLAELVAEARQAVRHWEGR